MALSTPIRRHLLPMGAGVEIARECGVSEAYVSQVLRNKMRPRTERGRLKVSEVRGAIAQRLARPVEMVFPPL